MKALLYAGIAIALQVWPFVSPADAQTRRVNAPRFDSIRASEAAVFWFGRVDPSQNYADVRVAYTDSELWVRVAVFDQWLWVDEAASRTPASLETWDAVSLVLDTGSGTATAPAVGAYRFVGELSSWRPRTDYQAVYAGNGTAWNLTTAPFTTETTWRGDALNNTGADRGWTITFRIPFASLGVTSPATGTTWKLGVQVHDRDAQGQPAVSDKFWPEGYSRDQPATWGQLGFGLRPGAPSTTPPDAQTYTIRHGLDGAVVRDAMVGGGATCAEGTSFFNAWGGLNHTHSTELVVQNQGDVADWPCFSKVYIDLPLTSLPAGRSVSSAALTIYQFGGSDPSQALRSQIQVFTIGQTWNEDTITWNNAPLAVENVGQSWVDVIPAGGVPWPGAARTWDLTWAVAQAYAAGQTTLRLALYSADGAYHSGKYFTASDTGDWNAVGRPTLQVVLAGTPTSSLPGTVHNVRIVP